MAAGDTALWLHNKLGSTDDLWSGKSICSQLSREKLINIQDCFHALQSHVKVKLLLSFIHIPRRNIDQWQADIEEIISLGIGDPDPWVATIGEILREFPATGALLLVEQESRADSNMLASLEEMKVLAQNSTVCMMPLDCQYLNKASLTAAAGHIPEPCKHFTVKRRPKSAALRAEIIQKSSETLMNKRNHASSSVPIKSRSFAKKLDITPIRGTPTRSSLDSTDFRSPGSSVHLNTSLSRSPVTALPLTPRPGSSKKDTKIKLLEIEDMPVGAKEAKRRKKIADMAQETQKKEKEKAAAGAATTAPSATTTTTTTAAPQTYTPDYAAGLIAPAAPKMPITVLSVSSSSLPQPSPAYLPTSARQNTVASTLTAITSLQVSSTAMKPNLSTQLKQQLKQQSQNGQPSTPQPIPMMTPILIAQKFTNTSNLAAAPAGTAVSASAVTLSPTVLPTAVVRPQQTMFVQQGVRIAQPQILTVQQSPVQTPLAPSDRKNLSLTKEQMMEAQQMFKVSNKVSRPEKALILGFMAGSRDNPCPQQGDVLNIKLGEKEEVTELSDGSKKVKTEDTYFQMNYATGEWKRFQKLRETIVRETSVS
ncbi:unnamed protein product [Candidula unifasciata]|uniref:HDAg domain-containing protein n=1 Tax=Candidula unifasciata TaxID=100452 RepID=A0A8S3ZMR7_9EUPU|nr:unnamed protein product [Candidula unifasciata]